MKNWLKRPRFSLRALILLFAIIPLAIGLPRQKSIAQHQVVRSLTLKGGVFQIDSSVAPVQSTWSWQVLGDDSLSTNTIFVTFQEATLTTADLRSLALFPELERLRFDRCNFPDDLQPLGNLKNLQWLDFEGGTLTTADVKAWRRLEKLECLYLADLDLSAADLTTVGELPGLRGLSVRTPSFDDQKLASVAKSRSLSDVRLYDTQVTDVGLAALAQLPELQQLSIHNASISGSGLKGLNGLSSLTLKGSHIDGRGVEPICNMKHLVIVQLTSTRVTKEDIVKLEMAHPRCVILSDFRQPPGSR